MVLLQLYQGGSQNRQMHAVAPRAAAWERAMESVELYRELLGLSTPWTVGAGFTNLLQDVLERLLLTHTLV